MKYNKIEIIQHGDELIKKGKLTWKRNSSQYKGSLKLNYFYEWSVDSFIFDHPCSEEEVLLFSAQKIYYESPLHFAWKTISFLREVDHKSEIIEIINETGFMEICTEQTLSLIKRTCMKWHDNFITMIPQKFNAYSIWDDGLDIFIVLEDNQHYYGWNWSSSA